MTFQDAVVLIPQELIDEDQTYFWTADWQAAEREASDDIAAGRVHQFEDVEDLIASLEGEN